ncbi:cytoplasmic protein [Cytobacillus depressus]|uniref:Cytoplasmic protein n=1 Tax=Cytobacillus depressus TaxID=1602942 RepID=A0A6L3V8I3_9BACI|nr:polymer-forming cytoskeletal protein [Cytobacillus depressus]KAB2333255.1 cytoplasmic protein [Cytobacillus depressus]
MDFEKKGDLLINGFGSSNGGHFEKVLINGKGTVNGDLQCRQFEINGAGTVNGRVESHSLEIKGHGKIAGDAVSEKMTIEGSGSVSGNVTPQSLRVSGTLSIGGNVNADEVKLQGKISVGGDCEAENFAAEGKFSIGGLLSAEHIHIQTFGDCKAKEIGGQTITVKEQKNVVMSLLKKVLSFTLQADVIEGDEITLENTKAKIVRGKNVTIGKNCEIGLVEYKDKFYVENNAIVTKHVQI